MSTSAPASAPASSALASRPVQPTIVDAVRALADDHARGFVFVRPDGTERLCTFHDIAAEAERRAAALLGHGLSKGDRLALVIPDGDEFVLSFLGALFAGIVPVPIYPQLSFKNIESYHDTVAHIARASGAAMLLTVPGTRPYVDPVLPRAPGLRTILSVGDLAGGASRGAARVDPDDLAFLQFTSGSTSRPKGVMVTHRNLAANAGAFMIEGLRRDPGVDKGVSWLPLFHDMGLIGFVVGPLFTNVPCVFLPTASFVRSPRIWLDKIHQHRGTITYAPTFAYALVAKRLKDKDIEGLDLSCLRVAGCGAEPIRPKALRDFAAKLAPARFDPRAFLPSYGMAESTLAITFTPLGEGLRADVVGSSELARGEARPVAPSEPGPGEEGRTAEGNEGAGRTGRTLEIVDCGRIFEGHELAIVDEAGQRLGDRRVGQIVVRGPSVMTGYYDDPELTDAALAPLPGEEPAEGSGDLHRDARWLRTGDLGYTVDGRLFVCGRVKDLIIVRGRNYHPSDIEWAVGELPSVRRGLVVAFGVGVEADGKTAQEGSGEEQLVVCCEGTSVDAAAIIEQVAACTVAQFGLTVHEVVVAPPASLPRTSSGKPQRRKARQMYIDRTMPRARGVQGPDAAQEPGTDAMQEFRQTPEIRGKAPGVEPSSGGGSG